MQSVVPLVLRPGVFADDLGELVDIVGKGADCRLLRLDVVAGVISRCDGVGLAIVDAQLESSSQHIGGLGEEAPVLPLLANGICRVAALYSEHAEGLAAITGNQHV